MEEAAVPQEGPVHNKNHRFMNDPVHQAILQQQLDDDTNAYRQAVEKCPHLIQTESPHAQFLAFEKGNVQAAACRLAAHWKLRLQVFGQDKAFVSFSDAFTNSEKTMIAEGVGVMLPPTSFGCLVYLVDRSRAKFRSSVELRVKWQFCLSQLIALEMWKRNKNSNSIVFLCIMPKSERSNPHNPHLLQMRQRIFQNHCWKMIQIHGIILQQEQEQQRGSRRMLLETVAPVYLKSYETLFGLPAAGGNKSSMVHEGSSSQEILDKLQAHGFLQQHLPEGLGGTWSYETDWPAWLAERGLWPESELLKLPPAPPPAAIEAFQQQQHPVHQAILKMKSQKDAYLCAVQRCPDVIHAESPHELFFRFCKRDADKAAIRLTNYWSVRVQVFNAAAFAPLCRAFSSTEQSMIAQGGAVILTLPPTTAQGRSVLWIERYRIQDRYRINARLSKSYRWRVRFWLLQSLSLAAWQRLNNNDSSCCRADETEQQQQAFWFEAVLVAVLHPQSHAAAKNPEMTDMRRRMISAMCVDFVQVHGVVAANNNEEQQRGATRHILETVAPATLEDLREEFDIPKSGISLHHGEGLLESLKAAGFLPANIPPSGGGMWSYERDWPAWLEGQGFAALTAEEGVAAAVRPLEESNEENKTKLFLDDPVHQAILQLSSLSSGEENATAYLQAVERCPAVIHAESPHAHMLAFEGGDAGAAARRMVTHWALRLQVFGPEKAFLPFSQALSDDEKALIAQGVGVILPPTASGHLVYFVRRSRAKSRSSVEMRLKWQWVLFQSMCLEIWKNQQGKENSRPFRYIYLCTVEKIDRASPQNAYLQEMRQKLLQNFCFREVEIHGIALSKEHGSRRVLLETVSPVFLRSIEALHETSHSTLHSGSSPQEILKKLQAHGFVEQHLPQELGGTWSHAKDWPAWLSERGLLPTVTAVSEQDLPAIDEGSPTSPFRGDPVHEAILRVVQNGEGPGFGDAYLQAVEKCPQVVRQESPHAMFLAFCDNNTSAAASRLVTHWQVRYEIFGKDAFQPLIQALPQEALGHIFDGVAVICPPTRQGRPVILLDRGRAKSPAVVDCRMKQLWFSTHMVSLTLWNRYSQTGNFENVAVVILRQPACQRVAQNSPAMENLRRRLYTEAQCLKPVQIHGVAVHNDRGARRTLLQTVAPVALRGLEKLFFRDSDQKATVHSGGSTAEVLESLQSHGFVPENLPSTCGGTWSYESNTAFLEKLGLERQGSNSTSEDTTLNLVAEEPSHAGEKEGDGLTPYPNRLLQTLGTSRPFAGDPVHEAILQFHATEIGDGAQGSAADYLRAVERCPDAIMKESPHEQFFRYCNGNVSAAARRLARHWNVRVAAFGPDAFQPIAKALDPDTIDRLYDGLAVTCPTSAEGRPVYVFDGSRARNRVSVESRMKQLYYNTLQLTLEGWKRYPETGHFETVLIVVLNQTAPLRTAQNSPAMNELRKRIFSEAMCHRHVQIHAIAVHEDRGARRTLLETVAPVTMSTFDAIFFPDGKQSSVVHSGKTAAEILPALESYGLAAEHLPPSCGGTWSYDNHSAFLRNRGVSPIAVELKETLVVESAQSRFLGNAVHDAILGLTSDKDQPLDASAYLQAVERCPDVIHTESPLDQFLCFCKNPNDSARRLASYWRLRHEIFGDAAFLPMTSAFPPEKVSGLFAGIAVVCPANAKGHLVYVFDPSRHTELMSPTDRIRALWFNLLDHSLQVWKRFEHTQSFESILLIVLELTKSTNVSQQSPPVNDVRRRMLTEALCLGPMQIHAVAVHKDRGALRTLVDTVAPVVLRTYEDLFPQSETSSSVVHAAVSKTEVLQSLQRHGFKPESLPSSCGGSWTYDKHETHLRSLGFQDPLSAAQRVSEGEQSDTQVAAADAASRQESASIVASAEEDATMAEITPSADTLEQTMDHSESADEVIHVRVEDPDAPAAIERRNHAVLDAMASLPEEVVDSFRRAYTYSPQVVEAESELDSMLLVCKGNAGAAALRLAMYWYYRELLFGSDHAFFPLTHALRLYDFSLLLRGEVGFVLPSSKNHQSRGGGGRPILFLDGSLGMEYPTADLTPHLRVMSFLLQCLHDMAEMSKTAEAICLCYVDAPLLETFGPELAAWVSRLTREATCVEFVELHLVVMSSSRDEMAEATTAETESLLSVAKQRLNEMLLLQQKATYMHTGNDDLAQIRRSLRATGLDLDDLPIKCGGSLSVEAYWPDWLQNSDMIQDALSRLMQQQQSG